MTTLKQMLEEYYIKFGKNFPICITDTSSDDKIIKKIKNCIKNNEEQPELDFEDDFDY